MRIPLIIYRYVLREVFGSFVGCLAIFMVAGLIAGFLPLLQKGMEAGMALTRILFQVLINALPSTLVTVLPLSMTVGILLALGRMSVDNEIAALKSAGISIRALLPPVLFLSSIGLILSLICTLVLIPAGIGKGRELMHEAITTRPDAGMEERTFMDRFDKLILYVEEIERSTGIMTNVFIRESSDSKDVKTIMAKRGKIEPDPTGEALVMSLLDGIVIRSNGLGEWIGALGFESYLFRYKLRTDPHEASYRSFEEMSVSEIMERVRDAEVKEKTLSEGPEKNLYQRIIRLGRMFVAQRFIHPMACVALALTAFPLGMVGMGKSRLNNVSAGLILIFVYYAFSLAVERAARSGVAAPELVLAMPPLVFIGVSVYFIACVQKERLPWVAARVRSVVRAVGRKDRR